MTDVAGDIFDSRDAEARIVELTASKEDGELADWEEEELASLTEFKAYVDSEEWNDGIGFIADDYFETYAREFASDIGAIDDDARWPANYIDWERAADALKMDYTAAEYSGVTYWYRG
jgi:hypothetical protein